MTMTDSTKANPWTIRGVANLHQNAFFGVERAEVRAPDGQERGYEIVRMTKRGVAVLAVEPDGAVHLVGQWRLPIERYCWELPAGGVEAGEAPLIGAKRELEEEAGLRASSWQRLIELELSPSLTDERASGFIAWDLERSRPHPEARERLERRRAHFLDLLDAIEQGEIREAVSVATILRAHHLAVTGGLPLALARALLQRPPAAT